MSNGVKILSSLRSALKQNNVDAYVIPVADLHLGEYIPDHWKIVPWLTGFTGSAATVVVTDSFAGLWTDSRYFIQAEKQLEGSGFEFVKPKSFQRNEYIDFLCGNIKPGGNVALDGRTFSAARFRLLQKRLQEKQVSLNPECDLISGLWTDRPSMPVSAGFDHPVEFSGKDRAAKISEIREHMKMKNIEFHLLTSPDDIMWMLNIRGSDLEFSPLLLSFALVGKEQILLFIDESKLPLKLAAEFESTGIVLLPYEETEAVVSSAAAGASLMLDPATTSASLFNSVSKKSDVIEDVSIPLRLKSVKNKTEIENIGKVMIKDGVALAKFFYWLENNPGTNSLYESDLAEKILVLRSQQADFLGPSFATIAAYGPNSALPHYLPDEGKGDRIGDKGILLIDSGGQYTGGTTDITRTMAIGVPDACQKRDFTLVLKGHIGLALARFPTGTRGYQLDLLARRALWNSGMNYAHGTGHGVGYCLNVHEGPQNISPADNKTAFEPGMLTSNEPAIYREGEYGIRTENLILCREDEETEFGDFLRFETVSLCHLDKNLIDKSLLDDVEVEWLNSYHCEVFEKLSIFLSEEEKKWLGEKTEPV